MKSLVFFNLILMIVSLIFGQLSVNFPAISIASLLLYFFLLIRLYSEDFPSSLRYLFINFTLLLASLSAFCIDFFPDTYLKEIGRYSHNVYTAPLVCFFSSFISYILVLGRVKRISGTVKYSESDNKSLLFVLDFISVSLIPFAIYVFNRYGLAIILGDNRVLFFNSLDPTSAKLYILISIFSFYLGYRFCKTLQLRFGVIFICYMIIRILSGQKFTELLIDLSLFFSLFSYLPSIYKMKRFFSVLLPSTFILSALYILSVYGGDINTFVGRIMAQSQLAFSIIDSVDIHQVRLYESLVEFLNFSGSNDQRLQLFYQGQFYGLFKAMELSKLQVGLLYAAEEGTSASGSIPIIFIYYYGLLGSTLLLTLIVFLIKFCNESLLCYIFRSNNVFVLIFSSLIVIRFFKFFVVGSPSYLYSSQFLFYGTLILLFSIVKIPMSINRRDY